VGGGPRLPLFFSIKKVANQNLTNNTIKYKVQLNTNKRGERKKMKKIMLFILMALLMPISAYAQKCEKYFCPLPEVKKVKVATSAKPIIKDSIKISLNKPITGLCYYPLFLKPSTTRIYEKRFPLIILRSEKYPRWEFLRLWSLRGYIEYHYLDFYFFGQWPMPRTLGFRWGNRVYFKWK